MLQELLRAILKLYPKIHLRKGLSPKANAYVTKESNVFMSQVSCLRSCLMVYCTQKSNASPSTHHVLWIWDDPRITMKIHQFPNQSPRQEKPWKLVTRPSANMKNRLWNRKESNFCESRFLQYIPCQMLVFQSQTLTFRSTRNVYLCRLAWTMVLTC